MTANKKGTGLIDALKAFGDVGTAGDALRKLGGDMDDSTKRLNLLRQAFPETSDAALDAAAGIGEMGRSMSEATNQTSSLGSAIKGAFSVDPIGSTITAVTAVIGVASMAYNAYQQYKQGLIDQANEATSSWNDTKSSLSDYVSEYKELRAQLDSGELSEAETVSVKQQILDIQNQIVDQYGEQASGIDLVNGKLETQLGIIQGISSEEASRNINDSLSAYEDAEKEMLEIRDYYLGDTGGSVDAGGISKQIYDLAKEVGIDLKNNSGFDGVYNMYLSMNADDAEEKLDQFQTGLRELKSEYEDQDLDVPYALQAAIDQTTDSIKQNNKVLDDYRENYKSYLEQQLYEDENADILLDYVDAIDEYNQALSEGDPVSIRKAKDAFIEADEAKNQFLSSGSNDKFSTLFDDATDQLDKFSVRVQDVKEILSGTDVGSENQYAKYADDIENLSKKIKDFGLEATDVERAFSTDGYQKAEGPIRRLAEALDFDLTSDDEVREFINLLTELGLVAGEAGSSVEESSDSYRQYSLSVQSAIESVNQLTEILGESTSGSGISGEKLDSFRAMFGDDAEKALEKTANGYHINREALAELQKKQEEVVKSDYLGALNEQYDQLRQATIDLAEAQIMGEDTTPFTNQIEGIKENIQNLQDLQLEYEATTSAYNQWQLAMSSSNESDMYGAIQGSYASVRDMIERGWWGEDDVRTYVGLLSGEDLSTAGVDQIEAAWNRLGQTIEGTGYSLLDFFTTDENGAITTDGVFNFLEAVSALNSEWAHLNDEGMWEINFGDGGDEAVANALGTEVDVVQSLLRAASGTGFVIDLDQPIQSMEELKTSAQEAKDALAAMQDTSLSNINLDASSYDEITNSISAVQGYIEEVNNSDLELNVKEDKLEEANTLLDYLVQRKSELASSEITLTADTEDLQTQIAAAESALESFRNEDGTFNISAEGYDEAVNNLSSLYSLQQSVTNNSVVMSIDVSQLQGETQNAISMVQQLQTAISDLNVQNQLKDVGVDIDTGAAEQKVYTLVTQLQGLDDDAKVELGLNTEAFDQALASIQNTVEVGANISPDALTTVQNAINGISAEALVKFGVDKTLVDAYAAEKKDDTAKVIYDVDASAVDEFIASDHTAYGEIIYKGTTDNTNVERVITGTIRYEGTTSGTGTGSVNGTAHAFGTVKSYRFNGLYGPAKLSGDWGIKKGGTSLVGELGPEILVRGSEFRTIGDAGAEFIQTRPGDIIFNHKQTRELLKNGYVTSRGRMIGANAYLEGSAYSSGSGPNRRPSRPSYNMAEDYVNNSPAYSEPDPEPVYETAEAYEEVSYSASSAAESVSEATEAAEEFSETIDWIETVIDRAERAIDKLSKTAGNTYELFTTRNTALSEQLQKTTEEISLQQQAYDRYMQEANAVGLSEDWAAKVRDGVIDIEEIADENLKDMIDDYSEWYEKALDCSDAIDDLKISVQELYEERFNNVINEFDGMIGQLQDRSDLLDAYIDQTETKGYLLTGDYYAEMIKVENDILKNLQSQRDAMTNALNEAVAAGQIKEYSESWYDMKSQIDEVTEAIVESETAIVDYNNSLRQLQWDAFDMMQDQVSDINDEASFLMDLLDANELFDEHGKTNSSGAATFGLLGLRYNTYMQQADMYREEMEKLDEEIAKDPLNQTLLERRQELLELQRDSIAAAEDEKDAIKDLVEEGINAQLDALQDLIDRYKDMIDQQRESYEYQQQMKEQQEEISVLEKQLAAYAGDNSEEGRLKRQEIENQLSDARQNLQESQYDQQISETERLLDDLYSQYEEILNMRLDNIDQLVSDVIANINSESSGIKDTIVSEAESVGYDLTNAMETIWSDTGSIGTILSNYSGNFTTTMTTLQMAIDQIKKYVAKLAGISEDGSSGTTTPSNPEQSKPEQTPQPSTPSNAGDFFIHKADSYPKNKLQTEISIVDNFILSTLNSLDCGNTLRAFSATT